MTPESRAETSAVAPSPEGRRYALDSESETPLFRKPVPPDPVVPDPIEAIPVIPRGLNLPDELYAARITVVSALREEGYTYRQIAKALGMGQAAVEWCMRKARERGILRAGALEAITMLDNEAIPLAADALLRKIRKGEDKAVFGVLEGRGILKNYSQVKTEGDVTRSNMAFQFVFTGGPAGEQTIAIGPLPKGLPGQVVGSPRVDIDV